MPYTHRNQELGTLALALFERKSPNDEPNKMGFYERPHVQKYFSQIPPDPEMEAIEQKMVIENSLEKLCAAVHAFLKPKFCAPDAPAPAIVFYEAPGQRHLARFACEPNIIHWSLRDRRPPLPQLLYVLSEENGHSIHSRINPALFEEKHALEDNGPRTIAETQRYYHVSSLVEFVGRFAGWTVHSPPDQGKPALVAREVLLNPLAHVKKDPELLIQVSSHLLAYAFADRAADAFYFTDIRENQRRAAQYNEEQKKQGLPPTSFIPASVFAPERTPEALARDEQEVLTVASRARRFADLAVLERIIPGMAKDAADYERFFG